MFFLIGFLLIMAGVALVLLAQFPLPGGRKITGRPARVVGIICLSFFPADIIIRYLLYLFNIEDATALLIVDSTVTMMCIVGALAVLRRAWVGSRPTAHKQSATFAGTRRTANAEMPFTFDVEEAHREVQRSSR
jgi:hypothetical protein